MWLGKTFAELSFKFIRAGGEETAQGRIKIRD